MSKGISKQQRRILDLVSLPGKPEGLTRGVLQAQLWPDLFCKDYRYTLQSESVVKEKAKCRVILSRAIGSLIKRGLVAESGFEQLPAKEVHMRGLVLPYALQHPADPLTPRNGYDFGRLLIAAHVANTPLSEQSETDTSCEVVTDSAPPEEEVVVAPKFDEQQPVESCEVVTEIAPPEEEDVVVVPKRDEQRLYEEGSCLSAFVLAQRAKHAISQISKNDPNAIKAVQSIQRALTECAIIINGKN